MTEGNARIAQVISGLEQGFVLENVRPDLALVTPESGLTTSLTGAKMAGTDNTYPQIYVTHDRVTIRRRAWECACVLAGEFADRLTVAQRIAAMVACVGAPDGLSEDRAGAMVALAAQVIGARR